MADTANRWWEFYFVRYAMGTVVGSLIVIGLTHGGGALSTLFNPPQLDEFKWGHFIIYGSLGLTFCYIASIPILVFHAARFSFHDKTGFLSPKLTGGILLLALVSATFFYCIYGGGIFGLISACIGAGLAMIIFSSFICVILIFKDRKEQYQFYKRLSLARVKNDGLVESYRHLREHGNSILIVALEILLGAGLALLSGNLEALTNKPMSVPSLILVLMLLILWIFPGAFIWSSATALEIQFSEDDEVE